MTELTNITIHDGTFNVDTNSYCSAKEEWLAEAEWTQRQLDIGKDFKWTTAKLGMPDLDWDTWNQEPVVVTALGEAERNQAIKIHQREAEDANLRKVFDEARRIGAVIVWSDALPKMLTSELQPLGKLYRRMLSAWGTTPPFIEVEDYGWYVYSIKPVWELAA